MHRNSLYQDYPPTQSDNLLSSTSQLFSQLSILRLQRVELRISLPLLPSDSARLTSSRSCILCACPRVLVSSASSCASSNFRFISSISSCHFLLRACRSRSASSARDSALEDRTSFAADSLWHVSLARWALTSSCRLEALAASKADRRELSSSLRSV